MLSVSDAEKLVLSGIWKEDPIAEWVSVKDLLQNKDTRG